MSSIISGLAGAGGAANTAGGYYQQAMQNLVNATGSPAAQTFGREETAALEPKFADQNRALVAQLNAQGIGSSGAGRANLGDLTSNQSGVLAGSIAPLYSQALGEYGNIDAAMPGAQNTAYQNAIQNFYAAISDASSLAAGLPPSANVSGGGSFKTDQSDPGSFEQIAQDPYSGGGYSMEGAGGTYGR